MPSDSRVSTLKTSPLFTGLTDAELARLAELAVERNFPPDSFIFLEGDEPAWFYIIARGRVKVFKHLSQGKEFIIAFFGPGEMFGEVAVFEDKPYPASAQAVEETMLLGIRRDDFISFLAGNPRVALRIISMLGERLREAQSRLRDLAGERVEKRIAGILLMLSAKLGLTLPFTRQEIADMAGTTVETAIRVLSSMQERGIVESVRGRIVIMDRTKLRLLSEGPPQV